MRANHIPRAERLRNRIWTLEAKKDVNHVKSPSKGNPYYCCAVCGIHDPQLSINQGRHFKGCSLQGLDKEIAFYRRLLAEEEGKVLSAA